MIWNVNQTKLGCFVTRKIVKDDDDAVHGGEDGQSDHFLVAKG